MSDAPVKTLGQIVEIERKLIRPFAGQPRSYFDPAAMRELATSMKSVGQQTPVVVRRLPASGKHPFELVDGQRRWLAAGMIGLDRLKAWVRNDLDDADDQYLASVVSNFARADHTPIEIAHVIARLRKRPKIALLPRTEQAEKIAGILGRSLAWTYQYEALLTLDPAVLALMGPERPENQRLSHLLGAFLRGFEAPIQRQLANQILRANMSLKQARRFIDNYGRAAGVEVRGSGKQSTRNLPSRQHYRFGSSLATIVEDAEGIMTMPRPLFKSMLLSRPVGDREMALARIDSALEHLRELRQALIPLINAPQTPQSIATRGAAA